MNDRPRLVVPVVAALALLALVAGACATSGDASEERPGGIVLVTVDGLIADELSVYGGDVSMPHLEELGGRGTIYQRAWTAIPMPRPAAATYLTGLAPDRHGVRDDLFAQLPDDVPTLAGELAEAGYRTAAFLESSQVGADSGLLDGFETIDAPPGIPVGPQRWLPLIKLDKQLTAHLAQWLEGLPDSEPWFAWVHLARPVMDQMDERFWNTPNRKIHVFSADGSARPSGADNLQEGRQQDAAVGTRIDERIGEIVAAIRQHAGSEDDALLVVAGTLGDLGGGETDMPGVGYSLAERAVRVPLIVAWPAAVDGTGVRDAAAPAWAPDVPATVAELAGIELSADAEGISLTQAVAADRPLLAWSWAPLDQMGWQALRAGRSGDVVRLEGHGTELRRDGGEPVAEDDPQAARLGELLADRHGEPPPLVPLEEVGPLLADRGIEPDPLPEWGRHLEPAELRREVSELIWAARLLVRKRETDAALTGLERAQRHDPDNLATILDRGNALALLGRNEQAEQVMSAGLARYPRRPELLHWYAHAVIRDDLETASGLLQATVPVLGHTGDVAYDLACVHSLEGRLDESERWLRRAIEAGYREWVAMESDPDLRPLRESGRFAEVLREYRQ